MTFYPGQGNFVKTTPKKETEEKILVEPSVHVEEVELNESVFNKATNNRPSL